HIHPRRIAFHRRIKKSFYLGKGHDLIKFALDLGLAHSKNCTIEKDILPPGQLRMKAGPNLQQTRHPPGNLDLAACRLRYPTEDLEECRLSRTIAADDADPVALLDFEGNVFEGIEIFV